LTIVTDRLSLDDLEKMPLDEARRRRPDVFRLRPDRRFLIALGELKLLMERGSPVRLHLEWKNDAWRIDSSGVLIGTVPEIANYADYRRVLSTSSTSLQAGSRRTADPAQSAGFGDVRSAIDQFDARACVDALKKIDAAWPASGPPDPELAALAARAYLVLSIQSLDELEMADLFRARALALSALAEGLGRAPDPSDEALLACVLDYRPDAVRIAAALPANNDVRMYAESRTADLARAARAVRSDRRTRYLALLSLASRHEREAWMKFQEEQFASEGFSLPVLNAAVRLNDFGMDSYVGGATVYAALENLTGPPGVERREGVAVPAFRLVREVLEQFIGAVRQEEHVESAGLIRHFEEELAKASRGIRGPLWDEHSVRAWHRSGFYSGLYLVGRFNLDSLGSVEGTKEFAAYLQGSPPGPAAQFAQWYGDLSALLSGGKVTDRHFDDLVDLTALGSPSVQRMVEVVKNEYYHKRFAYGLVGARVAGRLDSRPSNVAFMKSIAVYPLQDMSMVESLCERWLAQGWSDTTSGIEMTGRCLWFNGDTTGLSALLANREIDVLARGELLYRYCMAPGASEHFCRARFPGLAAEAGYAEPVIFGWSYYLQHVPKDFAGAQRAVASWLAHHDQSEGLTWAIFRGRLARLISKQGRHDEAWRVIQPALESGQGSVLCWGADILVRLGRLEEAYGLARGIVDRYPESAEGRATLADVLWRQKRYSEAAFVLDPPEGGYKVNGVGYRDEVAPRFADTFAKAPDEAVRSAFAALLGQGISADALGDLIAPLAEAGRYELAFLEQSSLSSKGLRHVWDMGEQTFHSARYLEKAKGRAEAISWLQGTIAPERREFYLESFFNLRGFDLVWDAVPPAAEPKLSDWLWLLRAGSSMVDEAVSRSHQAALLEHYRDAKAENADIVIGRYLAGLEYRDVVVAAAKTPVDRCKAAYFFGLQELATGRYEEASDWYQLVYDTCGNTWAWRLSQFAWRTLNEWSAYDRNLREAATHRVW
jgi:hypothetical protein